MYDEFDLIQEIANRFPRPEGVTVGIGDDGAVLDPGRFDLVTTDTLVEGVHFTFQWCSPYDVGWKLIAVNLSDIAAMGGAPGVIFLNLTIPKQTTKPTINALIDGLADACRDLIPESFPISIAGGDITSTDGPFVMTVTLLGESSPAGPVLRQGAVPGDRIVIFGPTGLSAAGLAMFESQTPTESYDQLAMAYRRPVPRVHEGALLGLYGIPSALIDISDGLAQDLGHLLKNSNVGASIETHNLPKHPQLTQLAQQLEINPLDWMLAGGEEFELLVTIPPARMPKLWELARRYSWDIYDIGEVRSASEGLTFLDPQGQPLELAAMGFRHFS